MKDLLLKDINLQLFAELNTNVTTDSGLSEEMKTFYSDYLIDQAGPKLVHDQFGQKHPIPKNGGKVIEFRKYDPLPKALTVLTEGVTPDGQKLTMSTLKSEVRQYGSYITLSDVLLLTAIDNNLVQATKLLGKQAGETLDTITREVLNGGTNVQYAEGQVSSRAQLNGGQTDATQNHYLTVDAIRMAVRTLKNQNAEKIGDSYVAIIHPDIAYDLMSDKAWKDVKDYDPEDWYAGEIGKIAGVRFVETTEAKIFKSANLTKSNATLTVKGTVTKAFKVPVTEEITKEDAFKMAGKQITINSGATIYTILSAEAGAAGSASITVDKEVTAADTNPIATVGGGKSGRAVYSTLVLADNAYGVTDIEGGGLQHIVKNLGSAGSADPLNQRATVGWKAIKTAERLVEPYMVRIETCSTFDSPAN
ncbi:MAG: N4-gp56 family major capsid protein [Christensenellales bacterium]